MKTFTDKCSKISLFVLTLFLTSLLLSSTIVIQQSIASTDGEDQKQEENTDDQSKEGVKKATTRSPELNRPSLSDAMPPAQTNPEIKVNLEIVNPDSTSPLVATPDPQESIQSSLFPAEGIPTPTPTPTLTPDNTATLATLTPGLVPPNLNENCALKRGEFYLPANDPCQDYLRAQCDDTHMDNPNICYTPDPRENPHGYRCINEQGQWSANVRECFPQEEDRLRELCGPQWQPGEECLIYGPEKTVLYGSIKVYIGNSPGGTGQRNIFCVEAPEGGCINDAPFAPGGGCDSLPASARERCEELNESGFDEMRKQYLLEQLNQAYSDWQRQKIQQYEEELDKLLDDFNNFLDEQGIDNPCAGLSAAQCNQWFLDQENCPGHPECESWEDAFDDYLRNNPDACAGMTRERCYDYLLGIDQCAMGNPLCADPYRPNISYGETGPARAPPWYIGSLLEDETDEEYNNPQWRIGGARPYSLWESAMKEEPEESDWTCKHFGGWIESCRPGWEPGKVQAEPFHKTLCKHASGLFPAFCVSP